MKIISWIKENKFAALIILVLASGLIFTSPDQSNVVDQDKHLGNNFALESIYEDSRQLPEHNTVCFPLTKSLCTNGVCEKAEPKVFNLLSGSSVSTSFNPTIARCDSIGCDVYDSKFESSGEFVNVQPLDPNGMLFKMSLADSKYIEIVTLGLATYISEGYCKPASQE